jgi:hypothetical protein
MPDMQSELSKVLNEWDSPEPSINQPKEKKVFPQQANISIDSYNYILANPNKTVQQYTNELVAQYKFKPASVSSLIYQMLKVGRLQRGDKGVYAVDAVYRPIKPSELKAARKASNATAQAKSKKAAPVAKEKQSAGIAALAPQATQPKPTQLTKAERVTVDLDEWINEVTLMQARMVYMKLKPIFEGGAQ